MGGGLSENVSDGDGRGTSKSTAQSNKCAEVATRCAALMPRNRQHIVLTPRAGKGDEGVFTLPRGAARPTQTEAQGMAFP